MEPAAQPGELAPGVDPIGPRTWRALREMGLWSTTPNQPRAELGECPLVDGAGVGCRAPARWRVVLSPAAWLPVCSGHRHALESRASDTGIDPGRWRVMDLRGGTAA